MVRPEGGAASWVEEVVDPGAEAGEAMTARRYTPPCRLRVKRPAVVQGCDIRAGEYHVWWGRTCWILELITDDDFLRMNYSLQLMRPQERPR